MLPIYGIKFKKIYHPLIPTSCSLLTSNAVDGSTSATKYKQRSIPIFASSASAGKFSILFKHTFVGGNKVKTFNCVYIERNLGSAYGTKISVSGIATAILTFHNKCSFFYLDTMALSFFVNFRFTKARCLNMLYCYLHKLSEYL